jgi:hypothetical protein
MDSDAMQRATLAFFREVVAAGEARFGHRDFKVNLAFKVSVRPNDADRQAGEELGDLVQHALDCASDAVKDAALQH